MKITMHVWFSIFFKMCYTIIVKLMEGQGINRKTPTPALGGETSDKIPSNIEWSESNLFNLRTARSWRELRQATKDMSAEMAERTIRENEEIMLSNNAIIEQIDERIVDISELDESELESMYRSPDTSEFDKSVIDTIRIIYKAYRNVPLEGLKEKDLLAFKKAKEDFANIYGFNLVWARETLRAHGSHYNILTRKERAETPQGSIEDIASAALESFVMNSNYSNSQILKYDNYLYGIMLDCTKRKVKREKGIDVIKEEKDKEEFQDRIIESMSWPLLGGESREKEYSVREFEEIKDKSADIYADYVSGRHFLNQYEKEGKIHVARRQGLSDVWGFHDSNKKASSWKLFAEKVRKNNDEVFKYNKRLADIETKSWADKIDLGRIESINNNKGLSYERKASLIAECIQEVLGVLNLDENGQSHPIEVKWFRGTESKAMEALRKLFNSSLKNDELLEEDANAFYRIKEKTIYCARPLWPRKKLSYDRISTLAHEMWHAKQSEMIGENEGKKSPVIVNSNLKARMYIKNNHAYINGSGQGTWNSYRNQIVEQEAFAFGENVRRILVKYHNRGIGIRIIDIVMNKH